MSFVARGAKNAFRNYIRTISVVIILGLSIGLALTMLLSRQAVNSKIESVKSSIGNTITISPAGQRGFSGGGEPLTADTLAKAKSVAHVVSVTSSLGDRLTTAGSTSPSFGGEASNANATTSLQSAIDAGSLGRRFRGGNGSSQNGNSNSSASTSVSLPVMVTGSSDPLSTEVSEASQLKIVSGKTIDGGSTQNVALVGKSLASKNNLSPGSTFMAYGQTITVAGIFDGGNSFTNAGVIMPIGSLQALSGQAGDITSIIAKVDSISNLSTTTTALESKLGSSADVVNQQDNSAQALEPLQNIGSIALYSLLGAVVSGAVIVFLTMLMIVRERRREIGVFKAIGSSTSAIVRQFMSEAMVLTIMGAAIGVVGAALLSNSVVKLLVTSSSQPAVSGGPGRGMARGVIGGGRMALQNISANVGWNVLLYGLAGTIVIALVGSAIPAYLTSKVRPAEAIRAE